MHGLVNKAVEAFVTDSFGAERWKAVLHAAGLWDSIGADGFDSLGSYPDALTDRILSCATVLLGRTRESLLEDLGTYLVSHPRTEGLRRLLRFGGGTYGEFLHSLGDLPARARLAVPDLHLPGLRVVEVDAQRRSSRSSGGSDGVVSDGSGGASRSSPVDPVLRAGVGEPVVRLASQCRQQMHAGPEPVRLSLTCLDCPEGFSLVMLGVLRAMADDYGALVMLEALPDGGMDDAAGVESHDAGTDKSKDEAVRRPRNESIQIAIHDPAFHTGRDFMLAAGGVGA